MRRRPVILVTGPDRGGYPAWWFTALALRRAGARPRRVTPRRHRDGSDPFAEGLAQGLVLGGGADISPAKYGADPVRDFKLASEDRRRRTFRRWLFDFVIGITIGVVRSLFSLVVGKHASVDEDRDRVEGRLLDAALAAGVPVLGICRGAQLINVRHGGTLHQDIADHYDEVTHVDTVYPRKLVDVEPSSRLHELLGDQRVRVNSLHRQAVDKLGAGLRISAREPNGVIQAIEADDADRGRLLIGVQWHPEYLPQVRRQQQLFRELAAVARRLVADDGAPGAHAKAPGEA